MSTLCIATLLFVNAQRIVGISLLFVNLIAILQETGCAWLACRLARMAKPLVLVCVLLGSALCLRVQAVTQIVAFGDSLTDDCTHGAKQVVDAALGSTAVTIPVLTAALA